MRKQILTLLLIGCSIIVNAQIKNLDKLPIAKRDTILLELAKQAVLYYGPDFYEINRPPLIERKVVPAEYEDAGRTWFHIKYFHGNEIRDLKPDVYNRTFLVEICIWEDTGLVESVIFYGKTAYGYGWDKLDKPRIKKADEKRSIFKRYPPKFIEIDDTTRTVKSKRDKNTNVLNGIDYGSVEKKYK